MGDLATTKKTRNIKTGESGNIKINEIWKEKPGNIRTNESRNIETN